MPKRAPYRASDQELVGRATHEPIILGDFVRLASGSPLGLVVACQNDVASVIWFNPAHDRSTLSAVCLRPA